MVEDNAVAGPAVPAHDAARYRALLAYSADLITILDIGGVFRYASPSYARVLGYDPAALIGTNSFALLHPDDVPGVIATFTQLIASPGDGPVEIAFRYRHANGAWREIEATGTNCLDDPAVEGVIVNSRDVTARVYAEREVEGERRHWRNLLLQAPAAVAAFRGPDHLLEFANPEYARIAGREIADLMGKPTREAIPELETLPLVDLLDTVYRTGVPISHTSYGVRVDRDGDGKMEEAFFDFTYAPTHDDAGVVDGILVIAVEVTDQVQAWQETERATAELEAVIEAIPEGVFVSDGRRITRANGNGARLYGFTNAAELLRDIPTLQRVLDVRYEGKLLAPGIGPMAWGIAGEEGVVEGTVHQLGTGREIAVHVAYAPMRDVSGAIIASVAVVTDVTEQKELERVREEFLSSAAHDLRSPLTSIIGYTQLATRRLARLSEADAATLNRPLSQITVATSRMLALISEVLDVARLRLGQGLELQRAPVDLVALTRMVIDAQRSTATQTLILEAVVPSLVANVDAGRIERVVSNLVANAQKYSDADTMITVRVAQEGDTAMIAVTDQGIGIPAGDLPHIFERFQRAGNVGVRDGSGVGLASALQIAEAHGGTIRVESAEGYGSTFTVCLPIGE